LISTNRNLVFLCIWRLKGKIPVEVFSDPFRTLNRVNNSTGNVGVG